MRRSNESQAKHFSCTQAFIIIALSCFIFGFLLEILLMGVHHETFVHPAPALRARIAEKAIPANVDAPADLKNTIQAVPPKEIAVAHAPKTEIFDLNKKFGSGGEEVIPNIVRVWRQAKLDWHQLLPKHNSIWERFGTPKSEGKFPLLVAKELQATDFLTRFRESGLSGTYGKEHGPLLDYSGCNIFQDVCHIHNKPSCDKDDFCHWDDVINLCVEGSPPSKHQKPTDCPELQTFQNNYLRPATSQECDYYISQPVVVVNIDSESQTMFYHWWATWASIRDFWTTSVSQSRDVHYIIDEITDPMFFNYFGLISNNCWRRPVQQVAPRTCFCSGKKLMASQTRSDTVKSVSMMLDFLGLEDVEPPAEKVKIGLISRRKKRFILNEYELVDAVRAMGYECVLLPLEQMTIYEQTKELRSLDILIGIHGSALDNSVFLHPGSVMVQLLPYKVEHRVTFQSSAVGAGMVYMEWQLKDRSKAYFHWDLLNQANSEKLKQMSKEEILDGGQVMSDNRETVMFWINQDIIVPLDEWKKLVVDAVQKSPASKRRFKIDPL